MIKLDTLNPAALPDYIPYLPPKPAVNGEKFLLSTVANISYISVNY
jgi:hypothetical protein